MAYRLLALEDVDVVVRLWLGGSGLRAISRQTGIDRKTVRRYVDAARLARLGDDPSADDVHAVAYAVQHRSRRVSPARHLLDGWSGWIRTCFSSRMSLTRVHGALRAIGVTVSYATLRRFAIRELGWRGRSAVV